MELKDLKAKPGSIEQVLVPGFVCPLCEYVLQLPGRKCSDCKAVYCEQCLKEQSSKTKGCTKCKKGKPLGDVEKILCLFVKNLKFQCPRKNCAAKSKVLSYADYQDHLRMHMAEDKKELPSTIIAQRFSKSSEDLRDTQITSSTDDK